MPDDYTTGVSASVFYAFEGLNKFNVPVSNHQPSNNTYVAFGKSVSATINRNQNIERVYNVGNRNPSTAVLKQFSGVVNVEGVLSNAYWLLGLLGQVTDAGSSPNFTHTYTEATTQPSITIKRVINFGDTSKTETLVGGIIARGTISASVGEPVKFSLEIPYRYETLADSENFVVDSQSIFTFAGATLSIGGTQIAGIENFEIEFNTNSELVYGISSRYAEDYINKQREYNIKFTARIKDYTRFQQFIAGSKIASIVMNFQNSQGHSLVLTFADFYLSEDSFPTTPTDLIKEDLSGFALSLTSAVYTNNTQTSPKW